MKVASGNCSGTSTVNVDNTFIGYGDTKEKAKANLMDKIAKKGEADAHCSNGTCTGEGLSCQGAVDESEMNATKYARAGGSWLAFLKGHNDVGVAAVKVHCACAPSAA